MGDVEEDYDGDAAVQDVSSGLEKLTVEEKIFQSNLTAYVGFDTLSTQLQARALKRGFEFNILVVGGTGLGKSTFVNTLFCSHLLESKATKSANEEPRKTTSIETISHLIVENGVKLTVTITDTPGFGDLINNDNSWEPIMHHIQNQYAIYNKEESSSSRKRHIRDTRIHLALYFIAPSGHGLKPLDIKAMQALSQVVNLVPVIAKSDSLTMEERTSFKARLQQELAFHKIAVYPGSSDGEYDQVEAARNAAIMKLIPFAVVGSERNIVVDGKPVRGRRHGWGLINIEDQSHCEFVHLRDFVMKTHMLDLIETTRLQHYEGFRTLHQAAKKKAAADKKAKTDGKTKKTA